jgi:iron complex transport system ATP-binding protein
MTQLLLAKDLRVSYGSRVVLSQVSLSVAQGQIVALVGPNGAGKTTLLKALARLIAPTSGSVHGPATPKSAYLAQAEEAPLDWSARAVVELGRLPYVGFWRALSALDRLAVDSAMRRTETLPFADRALGALSGGERQRVMLARALAQEPSLLLLDEPTSHLDVRHQAELLRTLRSEAERGVSSVVVLHDLTLAGHADRCVLLSDGAVLADDTPGAVLRADLLSTVYGTALEVVQAESGRRAILVQDSQPPPNQG